MRTGGIKEWVTSHVKRRRGYKLPKGGRLWKDLKVNERRLLASTASSFQVTQ